MKQLTTILLSGLLLIGCKKEETPTNPGTNTPKTKTPKELLQTSWKIESSIDNKPGVPDPNLLLECRKDETWTFKADGTYEMDAGTVKCDPSDPQIATGTWKLDSYPTLLIKSSTNHTGEYDTFIVSQLDETTFKYSQEYDNGGNTFTTTWKKK